MLAAEQPRRPEQQAQPPADAARARAELAASAAPRAATDQGAAADPSCEEEEVVEHPAQDGDEDTRDAGRRGDMKPNERTTL